jgi:hypothetical protein
MDESKSRVTNESPPEGPYVIRTGFHLGDERTGELKAAGGNGGLPGKVPFPIEAEDFQRRHRACACQRPFGAPALAGSVFRNWNEFP